MTERTGDEQVGRIVDHLNEIRLERFRAHATWGKFALTSAMTINGAASVTVLTFLGHMATSQTTKMAAIAPGLIHSMLAFSLGVALAALVGALAYFGEGAKLVVGGPAVVPLMTAAPGAGEVDRPQPRPFVRWISYNLHYFSSALWLISWFCFCYGVVMASYTLRTL